MTNGEKYKTAQERAEAFENWAEGNCGVNCAMKFDSCLECEFAWLDLKCASEKCMEVKE